MYWAYRTGIDQLHVFGGGSKVSSTRTRGPAKVVLAALLSAELVLGLTGGRWALLGGAVVFLLIIAAAALTDRVSKRDER
jgi:hypothetical protein